MIKPFQFKFDPNYMGHDFINKEGIGAFIYCLNCNTYILFNKNNGKYFYLANDRDYTDKLLTCEEMIIKDIIE